MQFTSSIVFLSFVVATFTSPVPDSLNGDVPDGAAICAMPLGTDLTAMPAITDAVYPLQHSHAQVTLTAGKSKSDTSTYFSMALIAGQADATWTQDDFYNNVSAVWNACSKGFDVASDPTKGKAISVYKMHCDRSARAKKNGNVSLLGFYKAKGATIVLCYGIPPGIEQS